jgi:hypothetical protein
MPDVKGAKRECFPCAARGVKLLETDGPTSAGTLGDFSISPSRTQSSQFYGSKVKVRVLKNTKSRNSLTLIITEMTYATKLAQDSEVIEISLNKPLISFNGCYA